MYQGKIYLALSVDTTVDAAVKKDAIFISAKAFEEALAVADSRTPSARESWRGAGSRGLPTTATSLGPDVLVCSTASRC